MQKYLFLFKVFFPPFRCGQDFSPLLPYCWKRKFPTAKPLLKIKSSLNPILRLFSDQNSWLCSVLLPFFMEKCGYEIWCWIIFILVLIRITWAAPEFWFGMCWAMDTSSHKWPTEHKFHLFQASMLYQNSRDTFGCRGWLCVEMEPQVQDLFTGPHNLWSHVGSKGVAQGWGF